MDAKSLPLFLSHSILELVKVSSIAAVAPAFVLTPYEDLMAVRPPSTFDHPAPHSSESDRSLKRPRHTCSDKQGILEYVFAVSLPPESKLNIAAISVTR